MEEASESKGLKVYLRKTKVMRSSLIGEIVESEVDLHPKRCKRVIVNSVLCARCGKLVHGRCAKAKRCLQL